MNLRRIRLIVGLVLSVVVVGACSTRVALPVITLSPRIESFHEEAESALDAGQYQLAEEKFLAALEESRALGDEVAIGVTLMRLGDAYNGMEKYPKALEALSEALAFLKLINSPNARIDVA